MPTVALSDRLSPTYEATAGQTDFPADFPIVRDPAGDPSGIFVRRVRAGVATILTSAAFTITGETEDTFTVRLTTPALADDLVQVFGAQPMERDRAHAPGGQMRTDTLEGDAEQVWATLQELRRDADRGLKVALGAAALGDMPHDLAGKFLGFDVDGNPVALSGTGTDDALRGDLAAATGAGLVSFRQTGDGAVARAVLGKLRERVTLADFGGVGDEDADDLQPLLDAIDAVGDGGTLDLSGGFIFRVTDTLVFPKNIRLLMGASYFLADHDGLALDFTPSGIGGSYGRDRKRLDIELALRKGTKNWAAGSTGLLIKNSFNGRIVINTIDGGFEQAAKFLGGVEDAVANGGFTSNEISIGSILEHRYGFLIKDGAGGDAGYVNANNWYGGIFGAEPGPEVSPGVFDFAGSYHIKFDGTNTGNNNNNRFFGAYLQGHHDKGVLGTNTDQNELFVSFEMPRASQYVTWGAGTQSNKTQITGSASDWPTKYTDTGNYNQADGVDFNNRKIQYWNGEFFHWMGAGEAINAPVVGKTNTPIGGLGLKFINAAATATAELDFEKARHFAISATAAITSITVANKPALGKVVKFQVRFAQPAGGINITGFPAGWRFGAHAAPVNRAFGIDIYNVTLDHEGIYLVTSQNGKQGAAVADIALAVVAGVDGTGSNAASKADVDARLATLQAKINALLAELRLTGQIAP